MRFEVTKPCHDCPFRREGFIALRPERAREISEGCLPQEDGQGKSFYCHKTVHETGHYDEAEGYIPEGGEQMCAGFLILAEKLERPTQFMRVCERVGLYDRTKLQGHDDVYDDVDEMVRSHRDHPHNGS